jgi:hypothetical protein
MAGEPEDLCDIHFEVLAPVHGWFTEGFDTKDLLEAKALSPNWGSWPCPGGSWAIRPDYVPRSAPMAGGARISLLGPGFGAVAI